MDLFNLPIMETLKDRLQWALDQSGLKKIDLAKKTGVSRGSVSLWFSGGVQSIEGKNLTTVAKALNVNPHWLATGKGSRVEGFANVVLEGAAPYSIPLISWVRAGLFCSSPDLLQPGDAEEWLPVSKRYGPHAYALRVVGDSMVSPHAGQKSYLPGQIIHVDPDRVVNNGSKVIARIDGSDEATFKVYVEDGGKKYLKPLNPQYPIIEMDETMHICGVVVGGTWEE